MQKVDYHEQKFDQGKLRMDLIPPNTINTLAQVLTYGANKYRPNGWKAVDDATERYYSAAMRHLMAWRSGEFTDPESGMSHLAHVLTNIAFLIEFEEGYVD